MSWQTLTTVTKSGLLVAILGFVLRLGTTGMVEISTSGGTVCTHMDFAALCLGGLAMALGMVGAVQARDLTTGRGANLLICLGVMAIGLFHLMRGLGLIWTPC